MEYTCEYCQKDASFVCARCKITYYCSKKCQSDAFAQHRKECFSLPQLKIIGEHVVLEKKSLECEIPSTMSDNEGLEKPKKAEEKIEAETTAVPPPKTVTTPAFNQGIRTVPPNDIKNAQSPKPIQCAEKQPETVETKEVVPEKKVYNTEAVRRNQQIPLMNQQLRKVKETRIFMSDIKVRPLKIGKVKVKIVNGDEATKVFFVTEALEVIDSYLCHIETNINDYIQAENTKSYKPHKDEMVLAKFEGVYYRAVVEDITGDDPNNQVYAVFFVDYGNSLEVSDKDMKPLTKKLMGEIILNAVYLKNFPEQMDEKQAEVLASEEGFDIMISEKTDFYVGSIIGI